MNYWTKFFSIVFAFLFSDYFSVSFAQTVKSTEEEQFKNGPAKLIFEAARDGNVKKAEEQIKNGIDVNIRGEFERTPLHIAAEYGRKEVAEFLIRNFADVNSSQLALWTPLHWAAQNGHDNLAEVLIRNGANVNAEDMHKFRPLHLAAENIKLGNEKTVKVLLNAGAIADATTEDGLTPLHEASYYGNAKIVELLLPLIGDINAKNENQSTSLHIAAEKGFKNIVEILLRNNADINSKDLEGKKPIDRAMEQGHKDIVDLLNRSEQGIDKLITLDKVPVQKVKQMRPAEKACRKYSALPRNRIFGGDPVKSNDFPWMAALGYVHKEYQISFDCGGTVISEYFILTAAHCVRTSNQPIIVRLGKVTLTDDDGIKPTNHHIKELIRHPNHSILTKKNDIGLVRVAKIIRFTTEIVPACLQVDPRDEASNVELIVTGWGSISPEKSVKSTELLKAKLQTMDLDECNNTLSNYNLLVDLAAFRNGINEGQYCAYDPQGKSDSCYGDSGGPLQIFPDTISDMATIVGIVSFGIGCGTPLPAIYTRVAHYVDWIESIVWI